MNNFDHAISATETAMNSAGSANKENERSIESLEGHTQQLKSTFEDLANNVITSDLVKAVLDLANAFLELLNTPVGQFSTQVGLLSATLWGGAGLIKAMNIIPALLGTYAGSATAAAGATTALGTATKIAFPHLLAISAAIAAIIAIAPSVSHYFKIWTGDTEYLNGLIDEDSKKLEENKAKLEDLLAVPESSRSEEIQREIESLEKENGLLQENLNLYNEKINKYPDATPIGDIRKSRLVEGQATGLYEMVWSESDQSLMQQSVKSEEEAIQKLKEWGYEYEGLGNKIEDFGVKLKSINTTVEQTSDEYLMELKAQSEDNIEVFNRMASVAQGAAGALDIVSANSGDLSKVTEQQKQAFIDTYQQIQSYANGLRKAKEEGEELSEAEQEFLNYAERLKSGYETLYGEMYNQNELLVKLSQNISLNENEYQKLLAVYPDLEKYVSENSGAYKLNTEELYNNAVAGDEMAQAIITAQYNAALATKQASNSRLKTIQAEIAAVRGSSMEFSDYYWDLVNTEQAVLEAIEKDTLSELGLGEQIKLWNKPVTSGGLASNAGSGSSSSSSSKKETDPIKAQSDAFKELNEVMEHNIKMREKQGASEQELIKLNKDYQKQLHEQAEWFRAHGEGEDSEYIRDLQNEYWSLQDTINSLEDQITQKNQEQFEQRLQISKDYIDERNYYADWGADNEIDAWKRVLVWMENEYYKKGLISYEEYAKNRKEILREIYRAEQEAAEEALQNEINTLQKKTNAYEALFSVVTSNIDDQIESLQKKRKDKEDYWNNEISALQKENDEIERQIELEQLQDNLARARQTNVMVYKDGRFQYIQDLDEISDAQLSLEKYEREEALRQEVENLEKLKEEALNAIDKQIKGWEEYKEAWGEVVKDYQKKENELLVERELGIKLEGENWKERLDNLEDYIEEYESLMSRLSQAQEAANNAQFGSSGGGGGSGGKDAVSEIDRQMANNSAMWPSASAEDKKKLEQANKDLAAERDKITGGHSSFNPSTGKWTKPGYARGTLSAPGGLSLVGENGAEMRVLNQGDGILPADITRNLWSWGMTTPADMMYSLSGMGKGSNGTNISIGTFAPNLPSVSNGEDFVRYLQQNFVREIIQYGNRR